MKPNDEILIKLKNIEKRVDTLESYLADFIPYVPDDTPDVLFEDAKALVLQHDKASASLLQRRLDIGYARAARILDQLQDKGIVGPAIGVKPRKVFR